MNDPSRILSRDVTETIIQRVLGFAHGGGATGVTVESWWNGELRWARNRVSLASDRRDIRVSVSRMVDGGSGYGSTNQLDDISLEALVRATERMALVGNGREYPAPYLKPPILPTPTPTIWSDATYNVTTEQRGALARLLSEEAEAQELLSAGYLEMRAAEVASRNPYSAEPLVTTYTICTQAQCSMTVRHPKGLGSGWAGLSSYDWSAIDSPRLAERALEKCVASLHPVAIEPGRYTVILEPQAVCDFFESVFEWLNRRYFAEQGEGPFAWHYDETWRRGMSKLGQKVVDERVTVSHDPMDPLLGVLPTPGLQPITWITQGVLTTLAYGRDYALTQLNDNLPADERPSFRISGGATTMDEMIKTTKRGLLVTRFSDLIVLDRRSLLTTGTTRDGLWLIENGMISKAVKNLRVTESPLFMLNQVEQLGEAVPVFRPVENPYDVGLSPAIVPSIKTNDFSFTSMVDAV